MLPADDVPDRNNAQISATPSFIGRAHIAVGDSSPCDTAFSTQHADNTLPGSVTVTSIQILNNFQPYEL